MAAPQTGLTSCQIGDMGHPRTVHGNPRYIPQKLLGVFLEIYMYEICAHVQTVDTRPSFLPPQRPGYEASPIV